MPAKGIVESYTAKWELQQQTDLSQCIHEHCLAGLQLILSWLPIPSPHTVAKCTDCRDTEFAFTI